MQTPAHRALASRRIALVYRLDPTSAGAALPVGLRPKLVRGKGVGVAVVTRYEKVRPRALPAALGISLATCVHGVLARWEAGGIQRDGMCVLRRDVDSRWLGPASSLVLPGVGSGARLAIAEDFPEIEFTVTGIDGGLYLEGLGTQAPQWPADSVFQGMREAAELTQLVDGQYVAPRGVTPRSRGRLDSYALSSQGAGPGVPEALAMVRVQDSWFTGSPRFPAGCAEFDSALIVRDMSCLWHARRAPARMQVPASRLIAPTEASPA